MFYDLLHNSRIEILATEYIQVGIPGLVAKVTGDVTCFDQLNQRVPGLVAFSEFNNHWLAVRYHIDSLDQVYCECVNNCFVTDQMDWTSEGIEDSVFAPHN